MRPMIKEHLIVSGNSTEAVKVLGESGTGVALMRFEVHVHKFVCDMYM